MENQYWAMICLVGIVYTALLTYIAVRTGFVSMITTAVAICFISAKGGMFAEETEVGKYVVNGSSGVPEWIFFPEALFISPIIAFVIGLFIVLLREHYRELEARRFFGLDDEF